MMFKLKGCFEYFECANCGCLQIKQIPADISKYYPKKSIFSERQIKSFKTKAFYLNKIGDGDSACLYLYKKQSYENARQ